MFRSKSCREEIRSSTITHKYHCFSHGGKSEAEAAPSPTNHQPPVMMRSYSTSTYNAYKNPTIVRDDSNSKSKRSNKVKKKGFTGLCEAEIQRKKRVASYNVYGVEGRVKGSTKKSFKWFKETCSNAVYGLW
ncbi:hypothetical protein ISN45_Aa02g020850 [Arabidopsis thaliana x Arabidopsis arenosa]|uniref:Uncharacterized protein n=1 Tax=Arabidopsis thaliana x Arabidopsis arenosa TaxID=1240361 RepID=A0A8T2BJ09_9BRAS|nr:hypothetical protein ISN45_Aa02g020850 [Arabidopsis thaliana x Arabidopsis arenosa]